jgi:hypothetical protein
MRLLLGGGFIAGAMAQQGWHLIARRIGGMPLGVAFFEDGVTGVTATSHLVPFPGYEAMRSLDGGVTWNKQPDSDGLGVGGLFNSAVFGNSAVISGETTIQYSNDTGAHFYEAPKGPAGGEIVRKLQAADGSPDGYAIMGMTTLGNCNGFVASVDRGVHWTEYNVADINVRLLTHTAS